MLEEGNVKGRFFKRYLEEGNLPPVNRPDNVGEGIEPVITGIFRKPWFFPVVLSFFLVVLSHGPMTYSVFSPIKTNLVSRKT